jgi:hypothetical protein
MLTKEIKKSLRTLRDKPAQIKTWAHLKFPQWLGFEVSQPMIQYYRNDQIFGTLVSFNHFIETFTGFSDLSLRVFVTAYNRFGKSIGTHEFQINRGARQFELDKVVSNLDVWGMFSLRFELSPGFVQDLFFLEKISSQYMTIYTPRDGKSAPQMIHSHKTQQGKILLKRRLRRDSRSIESCKNIGNFELFFINPSKSRVDIECQLESLHEQKIIFSKHLSLEGFAAEKIEWSPGNLKENQAVRFIYYFNRNVNHKKPILFRQFKSGAWTCNHT